MFQVNLTHRDIPDLSKVLQSLRASVVRHKAQNDRQQASNERPYLDKVVVLEQWVGRLRASNDRREHASSNH